MSFACYFCSSSNNAMVERPGNWLFYSHYHSRRIRGGLTLQQKLLVSGLLPSAFLGTSSSPLSQTFSESHEKCLTFSFGLEV